MSSSNSGNVGIVIVSHSPKIAEGAADMVRQMVGSAVPLAWTGGDIDGGSAPMSPEFSKRSRRPGRRQAWRCWLILAGRRQIPRWRWKCCLKIDGRALSSAMPRWSREL